jgi:hypothetical protein
LAVGYYDNAGKLTFIAKVRNGLSGYHLTTINGMSVYAHYGSQLGVFNGGYFRDHSGNAVAFIDGAFGGLMTPLTRIPPLPPIARLAPIPAIPNLPKIPALPTFNWSLTSWDDFIA